MRLALVESSDNAGDLPSTFRPKAVTTNVSCETRVAAATLLENGTEESQKLVRARSGLRSDDRSSFEALTRTTKRSLSWCQLVTGAQELPTTGSP